MIQTTSCPDKIHTCHLFWTKLKSQKVQIKQVLKQVLKRVWTLQNPLRVFHTEFFLQEDCVLMFCPIKNRSPMQRCESVMYFRTTAEIYSDTVFWTIHFIDCAWDWPETWVQGSAKERPGQMLSHVLFQPHCLHRQPPVKWMSVWSFSGELSSRLLHSLHRFILETEATWRLYLWPKLFSFLRQWRVTTLWPSLLTSWLTVHATGLLALAPRNATPSFSLTLKHTRVQKLEEKPWK